MATYTKPALSPQTFDELITRLKSDESERRKAIETIRTRGVLAFGEEYFVLSDRQRDQLVEAMADAETAFRWRALLSQGLADGVPIAIIPTDTDSSIDIGIHTGGVDIDIHIDCPF